MDQKIIKDIIIQWESEYPVDEWKVEGVHLWPFLRIKLYYFLLNLERGQCDQESHKITRAKKNKGQILKILRIPEALFGLIFFFSSLQKKKIIFFGSHIHRTKHGTHHFNRFFDPMIEEHQLEDKVYLVEYQKFHQKNFHPTAVIFLNKYLDAFKVLSAVFGNKNKSSKHHLPEFEKFHKEVLSRYMQVEKLGVSPQHVISWGKKINRNKNFFLNFIRKVNPEKIVFLSYYGFDDMAAAVLAAKELKVKTIDFQHGPQTEVHMAYTSWTKFPTPFYNTMPDEYWTWDAASAANIELWSKKADKVTVKIAGHPYIDYWKNKSLNINPKKRILYTLQTFNLEESFPKELIAAILSSTMPWNFRLHPRGTFGKKELIEFLDRNGIKDYKIESAKDQPLPVTLLKTILHLTLFSGCVLEAQMMGIPSILIHHNGLQMFQPYIDNNFINYINYKDRGFPEKVQELIMLSRNKSFINTTNTIINPLHL